MVVLRLTPLCVIGSVALVALALTWLRHAEYLALGGSSSSSSSSSSSGARAGELHASSAPPPPAPTIVCIDIVVAHCKEDLTWVNELRRGLAPRWPSRVHVLNKCGQRAGGLLAPGVTQREEPNFGAEAQAYLAHIVRHYGGAWADYASLGDGSTPPLAAGARAAAVGAEGTEAEAEAAAARGDPAWRGRTFAACGAGVAPLSAGVLSLFLQGGLYPHGSVTHFVARVREAVAGGFDLAMLSDHLSNPRLSSHIPVPMGGDPAARMDLEYLRPCMCPVFWAALFAGACPPALKTYMCALFAVSGAARIEARPLAFWRAAARLVDGSLPPCTGPVRLPRDVFAAKLRKRDAEAAERLWHVMLGAPPVLEQRFLLPEPLGAPARPATAQMLGSAANLKGAR